MRPGRKLFFAIDMVISKGCLTEKASMACGGAARCHCCIVVFRADCRRDPWEGCHGYDTAEPCNLQASSQEEVFGDSQLVISGSIDNQLLWEGSAKSSVKPVSHQVVHPELVHNLHQREVWGPLSCSRNPNCSDWMRLIGMRCHQLQCSIVLATRNKSSSVWRCTERH